MPSAFSKELFLYHSVTPCEAISIGIEAGGIVRLSACISFTCLP